MVRNIIIMTTLASPYAVNALMEERPSTASARGFAEAANEHTPEVEELACIPDGSECEKKEDCCSNDCSPSAGRKYCFPK